MGDFSGSESGSDKDSDEDLLILLPENRGCASQDEVLANMTYGFEDDADEAVDATPAPKQLKGGGQATVDDLVEINLRTDGDPRPTYVSTLLSP